MRRPRTLHVIAIVCSAFGTAILPVSPARAQDGARASLVAALDSAAREHAAHAMVAGVSVGVVQGGDTLLLKGYGKVDLQWDVPTPANASASYEIGSVTKQFTAAAILKLVEEGKLDLDEDFTKYLPDFETRGHRVPLRRLLDHTSGIKGYTEMPVFREIAATKLPRDSLVTLIENEPFEFEPGTAQIYNNSAYFLLGLIIEKVSGQSYEDFVRTRLFEPAGMSASYYCSESVLKPGKANGYDGSPAGLVHKRPLDHTWPYAGGSLCSTVGDLIRWNRALHGGRLLSPASYSAMTTPQPLVDGSTLGYAMGLGVGERAGERVIAHGGGINGYLTDVSYFPDRDLILVVLQNSTGPRGPGALVSAFQTLLLGTEPPPTAVPFSGNLDALVGEYAGPARGTHMHMTVSRDGDQLVMTVNEQNAARPVHVGNDEWVAGGRRFRFVMANGRALELRMMAGAAHNVLRRTR